MTFTGHRVTNEPDNQTTAAAMEPSAAATRRGARRGGPIYRLAGVIHKWAGLVGALWLAVLGFTGFFLNNDGWRWLQQTSAPSFLTTTRFQESAARNIARLWQIDPENRAIQIAGGPRGLWRSADGGESWTATAFSSGGQPQALAIEPDPARGWGRLWLGADDGLYLSEDRGATARKVALDGDHVTALAAGATPDEMLGVIDKSRLFRFKADAPETVEFIDLAPLEEASRPEDVRLHKFLRALHFGRGLFDGPTSHVINEIGALALFILSLTGFLYWLLPKRWSALTKANRPGPSGEAKRTTLAWLYRSHGATIGLVAFPALLYLGVTGVFVGHERELGDWLRATPLDKAWFTPALKLTSWDGRIESIAGHPGAPGAFSIGNMFGMFTTADNGRTFAREEDASGRPIAGATRMRRIGDTILVMTGMNAPPLLRGDDMTVRQVGMGAARRPDAGGEMRHGGGEMRQGGGEARQGGGMRGGFSPTDVTRADGKLFWKTSDKFIVTDPGGKVVSSVEFNPPSDGRAPLLGWMRSLHAGALIWTEWRWVNDFFASAMIVLTLTGLVRWWRRKWM